MEASKAGVEAPLLLYRAGRQLLKVRLLLLMALACGVLAVWAGVHLFRTYGLSPGDGGVLAPLPVRLAWGLGVAFLGLAFAGGMQLYARCYVARLEVDEKREALHVYTVGWLGALRQERYPLEALRLRPVRSRRHSGRTPPLWRGPVVDAPWRSLRLPGRRLPLILDEQGEVHHPGWLRRLRLL